MTSFYKNPRDGLVGARMKRQGSGLSATRAPARVHALSGSLFPPIPQDRAGAGPLCRSDGSWGDLQGTLFVSGCRATGPVHLPACEQQRVSCRPKDQAGVGVGRNVTPGALGPKAIWENNQLEEGRCSQASGVQRLHSSNRESLSSLQRDGRNEQRAKEQVQILIFNFLKIFFIF